MLSITILSILDNYRILSILSLSVNVLAALSRSSPQVASSSRILPVISLLIQILSTGILVSSSRIEDCYELLYLVANAQGEDGVRALYESGGIQIIASQMPTLTLVGSKVVEYAMKLVQLMLSKFSDEEIYIKHPSELAMMVAGAARIFGLPDTIDVTFLKALHFLSLILSSPYSAPVEKAPLLWSMKDSSSTAVWSSKHASWYGSYLKE